MLKGKPMKRIIALLSFLLVLCMCFCSCAKPQDGDASETVVDLSIASYHTEKELTDASDFVRAVFRGYTDCKLKTLTLVDDNENSITFKGEIDTGRFSNRYDGFEKNSTIDEWYWKMVFIDGEWEMLDWGYSVQ